LFIEAPCNGNGTCGKCKVKAKGSLNNISKSEQEKLRVIDDSSIRLACQAQVFGKVEVKILDKNKSFTSIVEGESKDYKINLPTSKRMITFSEKEKITSLSVISCWWITI